MQGDEGDRLLGCVLRLLCLLLISSKIPPKLRVELVQQFPVELSDVFLLFELRSWLLVMLNSSAFLGCLLELLFFDDPSEVVVSR